MEVLEIALLKTKVLLLCLLCSLNRIVMKGTVLLNKDSIFGNLGTEHVIVPLFLDSGDDVLNILHLLDFLIEFLLGLLDICDNLEHLLVVLKVEREVLGPGKEGGIRLAELVVF